MSLSLSLSISISLSMQIILYGVQGYGLSILRIGYLVPRMLFAVLFSVVR